jgi:hypothetical protein
MWVVVSQQEQDRESSQPRLYAETFDRGAKIVNMGDEAAFHDIR